MTKAPSIAEGAFFTINSVTSYGCPMKKTLSISICLIISVMMIGCGLRSSEVLTVPLADLSDDIVKLHRSRSKDGVPVNMDYQHPHEFGEETIRSEVDLLVVMEHKWGNYGMGSKWVSRPVFTQAARERLVPALAVAFEGATRSDKIVFDAPGRGGRPTNGEVYLKDDKLVWVFKEIDGLRWVGENPFRLDSKDWRIEEKVGMFVRKDSHLQVMKVVRDLSMEPQVAAETFQERVAPSPEPVSREVITKELVSTSGADQLEKKLETLKEWKDKGLITDEDFEKEKGRILEQLQGL